MLQIWQIALASPFLVVLIAELLATIFELAYVLSTLGLAIIKDPGSAVLASARLREDLKEFKRMHGRELKHLYSKDRHLYFIQHNDAPLALKAISEMLLNDKIYVALLWIAIPYEYAYRKIKACFGK